MNRNQVRVALATLILSSPVAQASDAPSFGVVRGHHPVQAVHASAPPSESVVRLRGELGRLRVLVDRHCGGFLEDSRCGTYRKRYNLKNQALERELTRQRVGQFDPE